MQCIIILLTIWFIPWFLEKNIAYRTDHWAIMIGDELSQQIYKGIVGAGAEMVSKYSTIEIH